MGVLEPQLSAKFLAISQLSVNFDKSQLLLFFFFLARVLYSCNVLNNSQRKN